MTRRDVSRAELTTYAPDLMGNASVVLLVSDQDLAGEALDLAHQIGRRVAARDRRVVLVDLCLERPALQLPSDTTSGEGIVDAFLYGASLQRVAHEQSPGYFVIGVGTEPVDPVEVWAHPRWRRLSLGFADQGALLLLLAPTRAVGHLAIAPQHIVALRAATGLPSPLADEELAPGIDGGASPEILDVTVSKPAATRVAQSPARPARPILRPRPHHRRPLWLAGVLGLGAVVVIGVLMGRSPADSAAVPPSQAEPPEAVTTVATPADDSLFYTVQVAAFQTLENALDRAAEYRRAGWTATVTPVQLGRQGLWYRLMVGAVGQPARAQAALEQLWEAGLLERPNGTILRTPHTVSLGVYPDRAAAEAARAGLRAWGAAAYIVGSSDGTFRLCAGAFETPEQARRADPILQATERAGTIVRRVGTAP